MMNKKNQSQITVMIQRCHKWRQKRKQYIDQARQATDEIERERLLQTAEHYGRIVNEEQGKIDSSRGPSDKTKKTDTTTGTPESPETTDNAENTEEEETVLPMFLTNLN
jgi:hypothetical protein